MMLATKTAAIILNPSSGKLGSRHKPGEIEAILASEGLEHSLYVLGHDEHAAKLARIAVEQGHETVVAAGGDGTVSAVASALVGTPAALGVLPLGTLNHFAKDLRIPMSVAAAARVITARRCDLVDVAAVNGRVFVNNSSLGIYPNIVIEREKRRRLGLNKWIALGLATLQVLRRYPFHSVRITAEGARIAQRTPFVFVGNNEYEIRGLNIGRRHSLDAGRLYVYVAAPVSRLALLWMASTALLGRLDRKRSLHMFSLDEAWIETRRRHVRVSTDGEVTRMRTPLHYVLHPRALKVIVP